jgi:hypothetical protein
MGWFSGVAIFSSGGEGAVSATVGEVWNFGTRAQPYFLAMRLSFSWSKL